MDKYPKLLKSTDRGFKRIEGAKNVIYVLDNHIGYNDLYYYDGERNFKLEVSKEKDNHLHIVFPPGFKKFKSLENIFSIFSIKRKYIRYDLEIVEKNEKNKEVIVSPIAVNISDNYRKVSRFIPKGNLVYVRNFKISKSRIEVEERRRSISTEVVYKEHEKRLKTKYQFVEVDFLDIKKVVKEPYKTIYKTLNAFILDVENNKITFYDILDKKSEEKEPSVFQEYINELKKKEIISEVIVPIIYYKIDGSSVPIGYIRISSKDNKFGEDEIDNLLEVSKEIVVKVQDANLKNIDVKQEIKNLGNGGLCLHITDKELASLIPNRDSMIFSVVFKLQPPLIVYAKIVYAIALSPTSLLVGVKLVGEGGEKKSIKIYNKYIDVFKNELEEVGII